jgi:hypothetical protein
LFIVLTVVRKEKKRTDTLMDEVRTTLGQVAASRNAVGGKRGRGREGTRAESAKRAAVLCVLVLRRGDGHMFDRTVDLLACGLAGGLQAWEDCIVKIAAEREEKAADAALW